MARTIEQTLAALNALDPASPRALGELRKLLHVARPGGGLVAAKVAAIVQRHNLDLIPELVDAFETLLEDGSKRDPGCKGKAAIARMLNELDHWEERVLVRGLRVVQLEGWGDSRDDTAAELRGVCGLAHAHFARADALDVLAELLANPERITRVAAATGLGDAGRVDASALLRYKLLQGDSDPEVLAACFDSLFALTRDAAIGFALERLANHDDVAEAAVIALGSARVSAAHDALVAWCQTCAPEQRHRVGYVALALLRTDAANAVLLDVIRTRAPRDAVAAARALATFKEVGTIAEQIREAARAVTDAKARKDIAALL